MAPCSILGPFAYAMPQSQKHALKLFPWIPRLLLLPEHWVRALTTPLPSGLQGLDDIVKQPLHVSTLSLKHSYHSIKTYYTSY